MTKLSLFVSLCSAALPAAVLFACATDNGDSVHGPQFGPPPERTDGSAPDRPASDEEGGPTTNPEAGPDADGSTTPACTSGTVAVLAGSDGALTGAVQVNGGAWSGAAIAGGAAKSVPSLVAFGTGFLGLTRGPSDALQSVTYGASWSAATAVGALTTIGSPALTVRGASAQGVYLSGAPDTNKFFRIENTGASWSSADPVSASGNPSFGPSAASAAAAGTDLVIAQDGDDSKLYTQVWNGAWAPAAPIADPVLTLKTAPPALVSTLGKFDLVLLYSEQKAPNVIGFATRDAATKQWSNGSVTQGTAQTGEPMSVARISPTLLLVTFRGNNGRPYTMTGTLGATSIAWSVPVPLLADTSTVDSVPAVAKGVCGDDAIAVFAAGGQIKATRYRSNAWSVPTIVSGASGTRVSVATR